MNLYNKGKASELSEAFVRKQKSAEENADTAV